MSAYSYPKMLPSEVAVKSVLPALRATVAKELIESYNLRQRQVAERLGLTQAAISHYLKEKRGTAGRTSVRNPVVKGMCSEIAAILAQESFDQREVATKFEEALTYIRANRLLCYVHKMFEPEIEPDLCHICDDSIQSAAY